MPRALMNGRNFGYPGYRTGRMSRSALWNMEQDAKLLRGLLKDDDELPPWVTYKIDTAADRLQAASRYMTYRVAQDQGLAGDTVARDNPEESSGFWKLSAGETAGVVAVGLGLGYLSNMVANSQTSDTAHQRAMLLGGAALYTLGVVIGAARPAGGWISSEEG